jgi:hypothetical protein
MKRREEKEENNKKRSKTYRKKKKPKKLVRKVASVYNLTPKILPEGTAKLRWAGDIIFFRAPRSSFRVSHSSVGFSVAQKGAAFQCRPQLS